MLYIMQLHAFNFSMDKKLMSICTHTKKLYHIIIMIVFVVKINNNTPELAMDSFNSKATSLFHSESQFLIEHLK